MKYPLLCLFLFFATRNSYSQYNNIYKESAWKDRDKWQHAERILEALRVNEITQVADIGCHQGYLTVKLAEKIGAGGKVYAVDVDEYQLEKLRENVKSRKLSGKVNVIKGDYDDPKLPEEKLDAVVIIDSYHEMTEYKSMLDHIYKSLKPGGRFVLIEPIAPEREDWTRDQQTAKHEIAIRYARQELQEAGFAILKEENPFVDRTKEKGDKEWMIVAVRQE
jgi:cyclopropane fatty-acyl-phospholipid synthase-like methyltransferase